MSRPEPIDVLIPVYNGAATVHEAIDSIQRQTFADFRMIVVNDGSTDGTANILADMQAGDPRISVVTQVNGGIVDALNHGIEHCTAEFIARHDADDVAYPERFEKQIAYLRANPDCVAVSNAVRQIDADGAPTDTIARYDSPELADPTRIPSKEPYLLHPFVLMRRWAVQKVGGYRYAFHAEDTDLYWRLREVGRLHNLDDVLGDYRVHAQSISSRSIVNGRIAALYSQLAGISAMRRQADREDVVFEKASIGRLNAAKSLEEVFRIGSAGLDERERWQLEISLAAKMLEASSYRSYELEPEDCGYIGRVISRHTELDGSNRHMVDWHAADTAARLIRTGSFSSGIGLLPPRLYRKASVRLGFRMIPRALRRKIRTWSGRQGYLK